MFTLVTSSPQSAKTISLTGFVVFGLIIELWIGIDENGIDFELEFAP